MTGTGAAIVRRAEDVSASGHVRAIEIRQRSVRIEVEPGYPCRDASAFIHYAAEPAEIEAIPVEHPRDLPGSVARESWLRRARDRVFLMILVFGLILWAMSALAVVMLDGSVTQMAVVTTIPFFASLLCRRLGMRL